MTSATHLPADAIIAACCRVAGCTFEELCSSSRAPQTVRARELVSGSLRAWTRLSLPEIAERMRRKYHSTAHTAYRRWLCRPQDERDAMMATVRAMLERMERPPKPRPSLGVRVRRRLYRMYVRNGFTLPQSQHRMLVRLMQDDHRQWPTPDNVLQRAARMAWPRYNPKGLLT